MTISAFRNVPKTGVIYVMSEAAKYGYDPDDPGWTNFGQGQPQTDALSKDEFRFESIPIEDGDNEYAPVVGIYELREAVANHYNRMYRKGLSSQYTAENVCICGGGRAALTRIAASIDAINLGHFLPDYTAYEELLDLFRRFTPIPILLDPKSAYHFTADQLRSEILGRGLTALLFSNPCNPTGKVISGSLLNEWVGLSREFDCTMIVDEFYSHYIWDQPIEKTSAAAFVHDVNKDPVVLVNGLTKNFRYPGWRTAWAVGPKDVIETLASAGSFLDGGGCRPIQRAAIDVLQADLVDKSIVNLQTTFLEKRTLMLEGLKGTGIRVPLDPEGTFYIWADVSGLPEGINDGMSFFKEGLKHKFICVPGEFFDVNPGRRRAARPSRFRNYVRLSFGPEKEALKSGLESIRRMLIPT